MIRQQKKEGTFKDLPNFHIPQMTCNKMKVLLEPAQPVRQPGRVSASAITLNSELNNETHRKFLKLEEQILSELHNTIVRPNVTYFTFEGTDPKAIGIVGEPIQICIQMHNVLSIVSQIKHVYIIWSYKGTENDADVIVTNTMGETNETRSYVKTNVLDSICFNEYAKTDAILSITPLAVGEIVLEGIGYSLVSTIPADNPHVVAGKQMFDIKPIRIPGKEKDGKPLFKSASKLTIKIAPAAPCLQVKLFIFFCTRNNSLPY